MLGSVHIVERPTGLAKVLTDPATDPEEYRSMAWSPDGTRLALRRGQWPEALVVVNVATNHRTTVTTRQFASDDIVWNPHTGLVTLVQRGDSTDVVSYPPLEGGRGAVVATLPSTAREIALSPDGSELAYVSPTNISYLPTEASQIHVLTLATRTTRMLGEAGRFDAYPAWSPDGSSIAFVSRRGGSAQLWVMQRDGREARAIAAAADSIEYSPLSWTPDGTAVLFVARGRLRTAPVRGGPSEEVPFTATFTVAQWSGLRRPTIPKPGARLRAMGIVDPELSPDGRSVVFGALGDLWIAPAAGGSPRRLVETPYRFEFAPRWSRDGLQIAYLASGPAQDPALHVKTIATGYDTSFVLPALPEATAWSPDGRQIAMAAGNLIGLVDAATGALRMSGAQPGSVSSLAGWTRTVDSVVFLMSATRDSTLAVEAPRFVRAAAAAGAIGSAWNPPAPIEAENAMWTWDLSRAAFTVTGDGYWTDMITRDRHAIADPAPTHFSWSADGSRLGYLSAGRYRVLEVHSGRTITAELAPAFIVKPAPTSVLIRNVRVIDGTGRPPTEPQDVLLQGGRIARLASAGSLRPASGVQVIDGLGKTLMPGLIDMHAHMDGASMAGPSPGFLYYGVLSVRDVGSPRERAVSMRERALQGATLSPRLFTSAGRLSFAVGHSNSSDDFRFASNDDAASIRRAADAVTNAGADVLKVYYRNFGFDARASTAAHAAGLPVTSHFTTAGNAYQGIEGHEHSNSGVGNEWTEPWRDDLVEVAKAARMCVTPTLVTYARRLQGPTSPVPLDITEFTASPFLPPFARRLAGEALNRPMSPTRRAEWERDFRNDLASMLRLHRAGVRVVTGTDIWPEGKSLHWELHLLVMAGFTPLEAIRAATLDAASCLGVDGSLGSVAQGKIADLVLVSGDPSARIQDAERIEMVFLGGRPVSRSQLLDAVRRE